MSESAPAAKKAKVDGAGSAADDTAPPPHGGVTIFFMQEEEGDYEHCTLIFNGEIHVNPEPTGEKKEKLQSVKIGTFKATLVDRDEAGLDFHAVCDAESGELQEMGCVLFSSSGKCRHAALKNDASAKLG